MNVPKRPGQRDETTVLRFSRFVGQAPAPTSKADETIGGVVERAVDEVCKSAPEPPIAPRDSPVTPKGLLGILAYCYAKRIYGSEEIQDKLSHNATVVAACHDHVPDASFLRRFRRLNRVILQACLEKALRRTPQQPMAPSVPSPADKETTTTVMHREAMERLDKAAFVDGMSMDP
jgi:hypothetical protein